VTFRELQNRCGSPGGSISPSVLNNRLAELRDSGIVYAADEGYRLTREGTRLLADLAPLHLWAERWAERITGDRVVK
jgi:DNA-binding HxlR family transcriptional regulator